MENSRPTQPDITVYTTEPCKRCNKAKTMLELHGLEYREVNLAKDPMGRRELSRRTGYMTFPQIVIDGAPLGGFKELEEADRLGQLADLLPA